MELLRQAAMDESDEEEKKEEKSDEEEEESEEEQAPKPGKGGGGGDDDDDDDDDHGSGGGGGQPPVPPAAVPGPDDVPFSLTPARAIAGVIDYRGTSGIKIYNKAIAGLDYEDLFDCMPDKLFPFLKKLEDRAKEYSWFDDVTGILSVEAEDFDPLYPEYEDVLEDYGQITLDCIRAHEWSYINTPSRSAQDTTALYTCLMREKHPNLPKNHRTRGLVAVRLENKRVNHTGELCVVLTHADYPERELYAMKRWCLVEEEGPCEHFFEQSERAEQEERAQEQQGVELPADVQWMTTCENLCADDIR